jgi:flagellin
MSLFSVNTNVGALAALQSLELTSQALNTAQNEVSTGQAVSNAQDNPAIYAIGNTINANLAGLSAVSTSLNFGAQIVATASSAVDSISSALQSLQNTVTSAGTSGYTESSLQQSIAGDLALINSAASDATFSGVNLLQPAASGGTATVNIVQNINGANNLTLANQTAAIYSGTATQFTDALGLTNLNVTGAQDSLGASTNIGVNLAFNSSSVVVSSTAGSQATFANQTGTTTANVNNVLTITTTTTNSTGGTTTTNNNFEFIDSAAGSLNTQLQTAIGTTSTVNGSETNYTVNNATAVNFNSSTDSFNAVVKDLANTLGSAGFAVGTNSDGSLTISGGDVTAVSFGTVTNGVETAGATVQGQTVSGGVTTPGTTTAQTDATPGVVLNALTTQQASISLVTAAVQSANIVAANLGSLSDQITGIQNFTSALSSALTSGVGALTDADLAAESAQLSALQTKQQLATQSLTIANQAPQVLLKLFQNIS